MKSNAAPSSYKDASEPFTAPSRREEMEAYDSLPPRLRRALDLASREWSALQAKQIVADGESPDRLAALIEQQTARDHIEREKEIRA